MFARLSSLAILLSAILALPVTAWAYGASIGSRYVSINLPDVRYTCTRNLFQPCHRSVHAAQVLVGPPYLPLSATRAAVQTKCPGTLPGAVCGTVNVPLDRQHPKMGQLRIFFGLFTHTNPGSAASAILVNFGGPGSGTTDPVDSSTALSLFANNLDVHDLLLIDDRGRGFSATINCIPLQHGTERVRVALADCASQLGRADSRFGTGDIAQDTEAVRAALGYPKVDYYGASYGGEDVIAYATRFGSRLRSVVLDAPAGTPLLNDFTQLQFQARSEPHMVALACAYSPTCHVDHPDPLDDLGWLIGYIQGHPVEGRAFDASGNLLNVRIDETRLLYYIISNPTGHFVSTGELVAAARSLRQGDRAPLLRLGAESYFPAPSGIDYGDPMVFSFGAAAATACVDMYAPWQWFVPPFERFVEYRTEVAKLPADFFSPFSKTAVENDLYDIRSLCAWWEKSTPSSPVVPPGARYPNTPVLVLDGDMDDVVPSKEAAIVSSFFPASAFVTVAESGHVTTSWTACAANLASQFIETLHVGDVQCTMTPKTVFPAVGRFPVLARDARSADSDPAGHNQVGVGERKAVTVAVAAAIDALQRSTIGSGSDHCLRAGLFQTAFGQNRWTSTLSNCSFAEDVAVSGVVNWEADHRLVADLILRGSGTAGGMIHVVGTWQAPGPVGFFHISGKLGGSKVSLLVPEA